MAATRTITAGLVAGAILLTLASCGNGAPSKRGAARNGGRDSLPRVAAMGSIPPGRPGLRKVAVDLPAPTSSLTGESESAAASAPKTVKTELSRRIADAPASGVIHLASGYYPPVLDTKQRTAPVTVSGEGDATKPVIEGARFFGASNVRFVDVEFAKTFRVENTQLPPFRQISRNIELLNSEIDCGATATAGGGAAIVIRQGARNIAFSGDYVHDCTVGFSSVAQDRRSSNVSITHSLFADFYGDAMDLGGIHDLTIADDVIRDIAHTPGAEYHDDGIQFLGNTTDVLIARNVIANSRDQLLFIQDAVKGEYSHTSTNANISVIGNLIYGAGAVAVQDQGGVNIDFVGNTIWAGRDGSLLIRKSGYTGIVPNHTLVADNIVDGYGLDGVHGGVVQGYNVFAGHAGRRRGPHDIHASNAGLQAPRSGLFGLTRSSRARGSAPPPAVLMSMARRAGGTPAMLDLARGYRAEDRGAVPYGSAPINYGSPFTLTGQPLR